MSDVTPKGKKKIKATKKERNPLELLVGNAEVSFDADADADEEQVEADSLNANAAGKVLDVENDYDIRQFENHIKQSKASEFESELTDNLNSEQQQ